MAIDEREDKPVPSGIVYSRSHQNFYDEKTLQGQGYDFFNQWWDRRHEFPELTADPEVERRKDIVWLIYNTLSEHLPDGVNTQVHTPDRDDVIHIEGLHEWSLTIHQID